MQDPILGITEAFLADQNPEKMNLGVVSEAALPYMQGTNRSIVSTMDFECNTLAVVIGLTGGGRPVHPQIPDTFTALAPCRVPTAMTTASQWF